MPKIIELPEKLKYLIPDMAKEAVVVGDKAYELVPLTEGQAELLAREVAEIATTIAGELLGVINKAKTDGERKPEDVTTYLATINTGLSKLITNGNIPNIVSIALDLEIAEVKKVMTIKQLHHFAGVLWKQNFDFSDAEVSASKNFNRLLAAVGFGNPDTRVYQWADTTLNVLLDSQRFSPQERIDLVLKLAYDIELLDKSPAEIQASRSKGTKSTQTSDSTVDIPASTSLEKSS